MYKQRCRLRKWTVQLGGGHRSIVSYAFERATAVHNAVAFVAFRSSCVSLSLVLRSILHECSPPVSSATHANVVSASSRITRDTDENAKRARDYLPNGHAVDEPCMARQWTSKARFAARAWPPYTCETLEGRRQLNRAHRGAPRRNGRMPKMHEGHCPDAFQLTHTSAIHKDARNSAHPKYP